MRDLIVGIDAGTSVLKAVAFDLAGRQVGIASTPNRYTVGRDGSATQEMARTWDDCTLTLRKLGEAVPDLAGRTAALAVTGQGDGTWLIDADGAPVGDGWLWLDARAAPIVARLRGTAADAARYAISGTGLAACLMGPQLLWMKQHTPEVIARAATAFHCKDWLYLQLTDERVTDISEGVLGFGDARARGYSDTVIAAFGLESERRLLPQMLDGTRTTHPLTEAAAAATGLAAGTPVVLAFLDVACTALGAGIFDADILPGVTIVGSTGMHMRLARSDSFAPVPARTGFTLQLPIDGYVVQAQSNLASTINIDWLLTLAADLLAEFGHETAPRELLSHLERWIDAGTPGGLLYHPYISEAGERGPFVDGTARADFIGLASQHRFPDLARAVVEGLAFASRDCYAAMGPIPSEIRVTGGAARSARLRGILAAALGAPVRASARDEAGAAGAAMMAAVAIGHHPSMAACTAEWVDPLLGPAEAPDPGLAAIYDRIFPAYFAARQALVPVWHAMAAQES